MDKTLRKGLDLLDLLSASDRPRGAADLARDLGLTRSNVFRLLTTLSDLGYVTRVDEAGRYAATLKVWETGMRVMSRHPMRRIAQPFLRSLHAQLEMNVFLSALDLSGPAGAEVLYLDKVETETRTHVSAQPGARLPAFKVASGLAQLSTLPDDEVLTLFRADPGKTEADVAVFARLLEQIRAQGWARTEDGSRAGVVSLAVPVRCRDLATGAIAVSAARITDEAAVVDALIDHGLRLSEALQTG